MWYRLALSFFLLFWVSTGLAAQTSLLPAEAVGRLRQAQADAAVRDGDSASAVRLYQEAQRIAPGSVSAEPLFRLHLLREDLEAARAVLVKHGAEMRPEDLTLLRAVLAVKGGKPVPPGLVEDLPASTASDSLYAGILRGVDGQTELGRARLLEFLQSDEWGRELAAEILLKNAPSKCQMCRERQATTYVGSAPVCPSCDALLQNPEWVAKLMFDPDPQSLSLMQNFTGEDLSELAEALKNLAGAEMATPAVFEPVLPLSDLLRRLDPAASAAWKRAQDLARQRGYAVVGTSELQTALTEGAFTPHLFSSPREQTASLREAQARGEEAGNAKTGASDDLLWLLNVANWCARLSPHPSEKLSPKELDLAFELTRVRPSRASTIAVPVLVSAKASLEQLKLFETLSAERADSLFLHLVLSQPRLSDYRNVDQARRLAHEIWLIQHQPQAGRAASWASTARAADYRVVVDAWAAMILAHPDDTEVLGGAASFFSLRTPALAKELLTRCRQLEPDSQEWVEREGHVLSLMRAKLSDPAAIASLAKDELALMEHALAASSPEKRSVLLTSLVVVAYDAGALDRARAVAAELLSQPSQKGDWNAGNASHKAHTVLGLLALDANDSAEAARHLLESARGEGSSQLNSFGPNMRLALRLLEAGDSKSVLDYLDLCQTFWKSPSIEEWKRRIWAGETPNFGANLSY